MKKFITLFFLIITVFLFLNSAIAQPIPFSGYFWSPGIPFNTAFYSPVPFLPYPPPLNPSAPLLLMPQISIPRPLVRSAAATLTIFASPSQSAIQVTALPVDTTSITPAATSYTSTVTAALSFLQPALLIIPTAPYAQAQTQAVSLTGALALGAPVI